MNANKTNRSNGTVAMVESLECRSLLSASPIPIEAAAAETDGTVDAADYVVWRKTDGTVDAADYVVWRKADGVK